MIRESIARHVGGAQVRLKPDPTYEGNPTYEIPQATHPSFAHLPLLRSGDDDGMCIIEPAVRCNHCGYCLSYGH